MTERDTFDEERAVEFLLAFAHTADKDGATRVARMLGCRMLSLAHASACLKQSPQTSFDTYAAALDNLIQAAPVVEGCPASVYASTCLSLQLANQLAPEAETVFSVLAFMHKDRFPIGALAAAKMVEGSSLSAAVTALARVALIEPSQIESEQPVVSVHPLTQVVMRTRLGDSLIGANAAALVVLSHVFPDHPEDRRTWAACDVLEPHAATACGLTPDSIPRSNELVYLLNKLATLYSVRGQHDAAMPVTRRALAIGEAGFGRESPQISNSLFTLASLLARTNQREEAESVYRRLITIFEAMARESGTPHRNHAGTLHALADLLGSLERTAEAEALFRKAVEVDEALFGPDHPEVASDLNGLATALKAAGRLDEAEPVYRRVVEIFEKVGAESGTPHQHYTTALSNLASVLSRTDRSAEADALYERAIAVDEARYGSDHPSVGLWLVRRVEILSTTGRAAESLPLAVRSVQILETSIKGKNPYKDLARTIFIRVLQQLEAEGVRPEGHEPAIQLIRSALAEEGAEG